MSKGKNLQDPFLNVLRKEKIPVSVYLMSGIKLQGFISAFDSFIVLLKTDLRKDTLTQIIYKHAISTISPNQPVDISSELSEDMLEEISEEAAVTA